MENQSNIGVRDRVLSSTEKNDCVKECPKDCAVDCVDQECHARALCLLNKSYESWNSLGVNVFSALSFGTCLFTVLSLNGIITLLSCNSVFSILSLNSAFSILSTNSAFAIGCVDKRFAVCF